MSRVPYRVDNGRRVTVKAGTYEGPAGMASRNGVTTVAYAADHRRAAQAGELIEIDGEAWTIVKTEAGLVKGLVAHEVKEGAP